MPTERGCVPAGAKRPRRRKAGPAGQALVVLAVLRNDPRPAHLGGMGGSASTVRRWALGAITCSPPA